MVRLARAGDGTPLLGDAQGFVPLASADPDLHSVADALPAMAAGDLPDPADAPADPVPAEHLRFGFPLADPGKLWGIGLNYLEHADDLSETHPEEPASFMKPATATTGPGGPIRLPSTEQTGRVTAEAELGVVLGRTCRDVATADADDVVAGYVPVVDMTAEDILQRNPRFLTRAKSFDTFLVAGPWIVSTDEVDDLGETRVRTRVNGDVVAENRVANMAFPPRELVSVHSRVMTLEPGDLVSTGTPGAGRITPGDHVRAEVEGVGTLDADVVR